MITLQNKKLILPLLLFSLLFVSCQTTNLLPFEGYYFEPEEAPSYMHNDFPSYQCYINKIDLDTPGLQLICQLNTNQSFSLEDFAKASYATYAINTTPFQENKDKTTTLSGITKFNNQIYTPAVEKYSALGFYYNQNGQIRAKVIKNQTENELEDCVAAFGGFFTILENNQIYDYEDNKRSRTAAGIDAEGRYLYLLTITSKKLSGKSGLTYEECASLLQNLGCVSALEFDGGHSTALISPKSEYVHAKHNRKIPAAMGFYLSE